MITKKKDLNKALSILAVLFFIFGCLREDPKTATKEITLVAKDEKAVIGEVTITENIIFTNPLEVAVKATATNATSFKIYWLETDKEGMSLPAKGAINTYAKAGSYKIKVVALAPGLESKTATKEITLVAKGEKTFIEKTQEKILSTMPFLPEDPKKMTSEDRAFYKDPDSWKLSIASFKGLDENSKIALKKTLNMVRYMVLTKRFAKYTMEIESKYYRLVDKNKHLFYNKSERFEKDYRVSGIEMLLLVRGMNHNVVLETGTFDSTCNCFKGMPGTRADVDLKSLTDEELKKGVDVVSKFGFTLGTSVYFPNDAKYDVTDYTAVGIYGLLLHELLHNYGYLHATKTEEEKIKKEILALGDKRPAFNDVPYYVQGVLDQMGGYSWGLYEGIVHKDKGNMPVTEDIKQYNASFGKYWDYARDNTIPDYYK